MAPVGRRTWWGSTAPRPVGVGRSLGAVAAAAALPGLGHVLLGRRRTGAWVMGVFAGIALWLCALGIYGVMSYVVTQRTREIGIRLALGAQPREVLTAIVGSGARLIAVGIVIGTVASIGLRRIVSAQLFDAPLTDPAAGIALALFALVGLAACVVPGLRATRLDPVRALHHE